MAKVTIKVGTVLRSLNKKLDKATRDKEFLERVGKAIVRNTVINSREGENPDGSPFTALKPSTINNRAYLTGKIQVGSKKERAQNRTGTRFELTKSNLTLSGQFLRAIGFRVDTRRFGRGKLSITIKKGRKPYRNAFGEPLPLSVNNQDIYKIQKKMGRNAIGVNDKTKKIILKEFRRFLRRILN